MVIVKIAVAGLLGMIAASALAQAPSMDMSAGARAGRVNVDRDSLPRSNHASNIGPGDTDSRVAPTLPSPRLSVDASTSDYLRAARASLAAGHTGEAQQSLEMAETRALGGWDTPAQATLPSGNANVAEIRNALHALGSGDHAQALQIIDAALMN